MKSDDRREPLFDAAESQTPSMSGSSVCGNRETPATSSAGGGEERSDKADGRTADASVTGESDDSIVPVKRANKAGRTMLRMVPAAAESVEGRGSTKGNALQTTAGRTQNRNPASRGLWGVREAARRDKKMRFTALLHHVTVHRLMLAFDDLKKDAAPGVDGVTWREYEGSLHQRVQVLHRKVHTGAYRAQPSRRVYIPKADGRQRPLGIASLEDKIVQQAVVTVLSAIYEEDFLGFSYGFRPGRGQHDALDALVVGIKSQKVNWILDGDIRSFFDEIDHDWMLRFLEHRIADRRILSLIRKWLKAGVIEDGRRVAAERGTPQGSVISPLLANIYLHYVLDLWAHHWRKQHATGGDVIIVRYADGTPVQTSI